MLWLLTWHNNAILLSTIVMILLFTTLIFGFNLTTIPTLYKITISAYFGWISVALIANITVLFTAYNIVPFNLSETFWFITIIIVGLGIALTTLIVTKNTVYSMVFIWAYFGRFSRYLFESSPIKPVALSLVGTSLIILIGFTLFQWIQNNQKLF